MSRRVIRAGHVAQMDKAGRNSCIFMEKLMEEVNWKAKACSLHGQIL
jgi:hypothetical protein